MKQTQRLASELDAAQRYIFRDEVPVLGRTKRLAVIIDQMSMPALPRLMSNVEERKRLQKHGVLRTLLQGAHGRIEVVKKVVGEAIEQEKRKPFFVPMYSLEEAEPHEQLHQEAMTMEEFHKMCMQ